MKCLVFTKPPEGFYASVEVAGCYCEWDQKILFLKRHPHRPQGDTWGVPAGKMEKNETPRMTVIREIREEIGINIDDSDLKYLGQLYCRLPHLDYIYHLFCKKFTELPVIELRLEEHLEMAWVTFDEALKLRLIAGGAEALQYYRHGFLAGLEKS